MYTHIKKKLGLYGWWLELLQGHTKSQIFNKGHTKSQIVAVQKEIKAVSLTQLMMNMNVKYSSYYYNPQVLCSYLVRIY